MQVSCLHKVAKIRATTLGTKKVPLSQLATNLPYCLFPWSVLGRHDCRKEWYKCLPQAERPEEQGSDLSTVMQSWKISAEGGASITGLSFLFKVNCARRAFDMTYYSYCALTVTPSFTFLRWCMIFS